jgi:biopolymer transport protein ExbD
MRRTSIYTQRGSMEIKMTPMIDVVFLLLVFFVWTASFQIVEQILPSNLSVAAGTEPTDATEPPPVKDFPDVVIRVTWNGRQPSWQVNGIPLANLDEVRSRLQQISQIKTDAPVILHPDKNVPLGHVIDVYDLARLARFQKVQFAASEKI